MDDLYADFAERYDLAYDLFAQDDPKMAGFFRELFAENHARRVLDCACGTGRHLPMFNSLGMRVTGSDISPSMLGQARKNLDRLGLAIPLQEADFRDLPQYFVDPFDAIICLGAIGYIPDAKELLRAFESMMNVLRPGGILILTSIPTDKQWNEKNRFFLAANTQKASRVFAVDYLDHSARYNILDIFHDENRNELRIWSAELSIFLKDEQEKLLKEAGFTTIDFYSSFDFNPYDVKGSELLIATARK
jgi:glycine/sarcosine N-methyltransferase